MTINESKKYSSYDVSDNEELLGILKRAAEISNIKLVLGSTGGGSDANILNSKGIPSCNISVGMENVHTVKERIKIQDMMDSVLFLVNIVRSV